MAVANEPSWIGKWPRPKAKPIGNACLIGSKSAGCGKTAGLQAIIRDGKGELGAAVAQVYGGLVLDQRCIFHKLRNVADKAREDLGGEAHRQTRQELLKQAAAIYEAPDAAQARERLASFVSHWQEQAPKAVSTLQRDFETTIAYYRLPEMARELVRTTSLLERANRELRRKFRQACCFSSREARTGGYLLAGPALQCSLGQAVLGTHCPHALFRFCKARSLEIDTLPNVGPEARNIGDVVQV